MQCLKYSIFYLLVLVLNHVHSYNILALFPHPGKSHVDVFLPLLKGLAEKGHNVTSLSHFDLKKPIPNYTHLSLDPGHKSSLVNVFDVKDIGGGSLLQKYLTPLMLGDFANTSCENGLNSKAAQNLLQSKQHFDVIIAEFFNSDCFLGFVHKFQAPVIGISSCTIMPWTNERFANPSHPAYIPNNLLSHSDKLSFFARLENTVITTLHDLYFKHVMSRNDDWIARKYFGRKLPRLESIINNSSLLLVNSHYSLNLPRPLVPNVIEVGGIHVGKPQPLAKNLEKWMNESAEGVIYFSLGSMIKGTTFPEDKKQAFLKAFGRLSHRVLWKWENETMPGKPDNVMIQKWMPQFDILCHPKVKAFISHGGLLGTTEAVHCGVPVIVMPQFGDQHTNAKALEASGGGVILQLREATEETVYKALKKVLSSDFNQKAKELSARFRDRPLPPLETAIYWVEYVARHRGAPHMRTAAVDMPFYQYYLLDVFGFLLLIIAAITYINLKICKFLFKKIIDSLSNNKVKTS